MDNPLPRETALDRLAADYARVRRPSEAQRSFIYASLIACPPPEHVRAEMEAAARGEEP